MFKKKIVVRRKRNSSSKSSFWAGFFTGKKSRKLKKVFKKTFSSKAKDLAFFRKMESGTGNWFKKQSASNKKRYYNIVDRYSL